MVLNAEENQKDNGKTIQEISSINDDKDALEVQVITTSKGRAFRNVMIICFVELLVFTGFWSLSNLESTMNASQGLGVISQAVVYVFSMISCFLPEFVIEKFGTKSTIVITLFLSCPFFAANFSLRWSIMIAASALYGIVSGPFNSAVSLYIDEMANRFKASSDESRENIGAFFFGFFVMSTELTQVFGNMLSYYVLVGDHPPSPMNMSAGKECGVHFNKDAENGTNSNLDPPSDHDRYMICGIFLTLALIGVIVALFLDPLKNDVKEIKGCRSFTNKIFSSVRHLKNPHQLLLLPLTVYLGIEGSFYAAEFTEAFIACSWGVHHVGFVSICFGACGALMAISMGPLVKCVSQMSVIILAAILNVVTFSLLFVWQPSPDVPFAYFAFAGVWGMTDAIWWSQVGALYGLMFPKDREAAFSNFFFWSFLGFFLSYSYANYFTVAVKIIIMMVFLIVGMTLYVIGQVQIKCCSARGGYVAIDVSG